MGWYCHDLVASFPSSFRQILFQDFSIIYLFIRHTHQSVCLMSTSPLIFRPGDEAPVRGRRRLRRAIPQGWSASQSLNPAALVNNAAEAADEAHLAVKLKGRAAVI